MKTDCIVATFENILNEDTCHELAKKHKFIRRASSRLKGHEIIMTLILPRNGISEESLKELSRHIRRFNPNADLSSQALAQRINTSSAVALMKNVYSILLQKIREKCINEMPVIPGILEHFGAVYLQDSTSITLNEKLQNKYKGTRRGGTTLESQVKIDLIHDVKSGMIVDASIFSGNQPDQSLSGRILEFIKPGDLVIRDLGYFVSDVFSQISEQGAFFLSRLQPNIKIYINESDEEPVDLGMYIHKNLRNNRLADFDVYIGNQKIKTRLVLYKQPKEVANKRLREAKKQARKKGRTLSKSKKALTQVAAFITTVPRGNLSSEVVGTVYRLRWEIELIFKRWKSQLKIDVLKGINPYRIDCLIWARLCTVILIAVTTKIFESMTEADREISPTRLINYLKWGDAFFESVRKIEIYIFFEEMIKDMPKMLYKDKRARRTAFERVLCEEHYYEEVA